MQHVGTRWIGARPIYKNTKIEFYFLIIQNVMVDAEIAKNALKKLDDDLKFIHDLCIRISDTYNRTSHVGGVGTDTGGIMYNTCVTTYLDKKVVNRAAHWQNWKNNKDNKYN